MYYENNRSHEFVLHILHLNVSQLFAIECCGQQCNEEDKEVVTKFCNILVKYGTMDTEYFLRKQLDDVLVCFAYCIYYFTMVLCTDVYTRFLVHNQHSLYRVDRLSKWMMKTCQYPLTVKCVRS